MHANESPINKQYCQSFSYFQNKEIHKHTYTDVSEMPDTTSVAMHKNNVKCLCKYGSLDAPNVTYGPFSLVGEG